MNDVVVLNHIQEDRENPYLYCHYYCRHDEFCRVDTGCQAANSLDIATTDFELVKILVEEGGLEAIKCNPRVLYDFVYTVLCNIEHREEWFDYLVNSNFKYDVNYDYEPVRYTNLILLFVSKYYCTNTTNTIVCRFVYLIRFVFT